MQNVTAEFKSSCRAPVVKKKIALLLGHKKFDLIYTLLSYKHAVWNWRGGDVSHSAWSTSQGKSNVKTF